MRAGGQAEMTNRRQRTVYGSHPRKREDGLNCTGAGDRGRITPRSTHLAPVGGEHSVAECVECRGCGAAVYESRVSLADEAIAQRIAATRGRASRKRLFGRPEIISMGRIITSAPGTWLVTGRDFRRSARLLYLWRRCGDRAVAEVAGLLFPYAADAVISTEPADRADFGPQTFADWMGGLYNDSKIRLSPKCGSGAGLCVG